MRYLFLLMGLLCAASVAGQANLIANGEFDDGLSGWQTVINDEAEVDVATVDTAGLSGTNAVRIANVLPGPNAFSTGLAQTVEVDNESPARYRITFLARAGADRQIVFQYKVGEQSLYYESQSLTTESQAFTFEFDRSANENVQLLFFTGIETAPVYLDAVTLIELEAPEPPGEAPGNFSQVAVGGGGYVTGIHYHPTGCGLLYMRTDVGGAFRYNYESQEWLALFTDFTLEEENYFGVNGLALAPSDDSIVYVAADKAEYFSGPSDVLVSRDRGTTWEPTGLNQRFFGFGDGKFFSKVHGPSLAVDPNDADRLYAGTINNGLWYKGGREASWERVDGVPTGILNVGVRSIVYGPNHTLYVGVKGDGIFVRASASGEFTTVAGAPIDIIEMDVDSAGRIYVAAESGLYTYDTTGSWASTNAGQAFSSVSVHPGDNGRVVALGTGFGSGKGPILLSEDFGLSWRGVTYDRENFPGWYPESFFSNAGSSITFDPCQEAAVTYGDFFAVWQTDDISRSPNSVWSTYSRGHEETYVTDILAPPTGPRLYAAFADVLGFSWEEDISRFPDSTLTENFDFNAEPFLNNGSSFDYCANRSEAKVFAATTNNFGGPGYILRSDDEFATYTLRAVPGSMGRVSMSANDPDNMVIHTHGDSSRVFFTVDGGASWNLSAGAPEGIVDGFFRSARPLAVDRQLPGTFYFYDQFGRVYLSEDGGASFTLASNSLPTNVPFDSYEMKARPDAAGEVWASLDEAGLYRSVDKGRSFTRVETIQRSVTFGFGSGRTEGDASAVYVYGVADGQEGLFYSEDAGASWTKAAIGRTWPNRPRSLTADMRAFGQVYIGSNGSGILYVNVESDTATVSVLHPATEESVVTDLVAYPNPAGESVRLAFTSDQGFTGRLEWFTIHGRRLSGRVVFVVPGENSLTAPLLGLPRGTLIGTLTGPSGRARVRIVHR